MNSGLSCMFARSARITHWWDSGRSRRHGGSWPGWVWPGGKGRVGGGQWDSSVCLEEGHTHRPAEVKSSSSDSIPDFLPPLENLKVQQKGLARLEEEFRVCAVLVDRTVDKEGGCAHVFVKLVISLTLGIQWKHITGSSLHQNLSPGTSLLIYVACMHVDERGA